MILTFPIRPMLTKSILDELSADQIAMEEMCWYEENKTYRMLGKTVTAIHV